MTKKNEPTTQTNHPTKENLVVKKPDASKTSVVGPKHPNETPGCFIPEARSRGKRKYVWSWIKHILVRTASLIRLGCRN